METSLLKQNVQKCISETIQELTDIESSQFCEKPEESIVFKKILLKRKIRNLKELLSLLDIEGMGKCAKCGEEISLDKLIEKPSNTRCEACSVGI